MSWSIVKLSDVCDEVPTRGHKVVTALLQEHGAIPVISQSSRAIEGYVSEGNKIQTLPVVLFGDHTCVVKYVDFPFIVGADGVKLLRPALEYQTKLDVRFLYYGVKNIAFSLVDGHYKRHFTALREEEFPLPPLWVQYQIVEDLEWKLARLEKIEGNFRAMAETAAQASRSVLTGTFRSLDAPIVKLGDVCDCLDALRIPITKCDRKPGNVPYYGATGIQDYVAGHLFNEPLVLLGEDGAKWGAGERSAFLVEGKSWVNNHVHILRPTDSLLASFLIAYLNATDLTKWVSGVTVPKLTQGRMKQIPLPLPSLPDQKQIVEELEWKLSRLEKVERLAQEGLTVCEQARRAILAEAFRQADGADVRQDCSAAGQAEPSAQ